MNPDICGYQAPKKADYIMDGMKNMRRNGRKIFLVLALILVIGLAVSIYASYNCLTVREYTYSRVRDIFSQSWRPEFLKCLCTDSMNDY